MTTNIQPQLTKHITRGVSHDQEKVGPIILTNSFFCKSHIIPKEIPENVQVPNLYWMLSITQSSARLLRVDHLNSTVSNKVNLNYEKANELVTTKAKKLFYRRYAPAFSHI